MLSGKKITRDSYKCSFCPPGSLTSEDGIPLVLSGNEGIQIAQLLEITGKEACCHHCRFLILRVVGAVKKKPELAG